VFRKGDLDAAMNDSPGRANGVVVNMNITTSDVGSFRRSQSQLSAEVGRMISQGQSRQG